MFECLIVLACALTMIIKKRINAPLCFYAITQVLAAREAHQLLSIMCMLTGYALAVLQRRSAVSLSMATGLLVASMAISETLITGGRAGGLDNPNIIAGWIMLAPLTGWIGLAGMMATQSRAALVGYLIPKVLALRKYAALAALGLAPLVLYLAAMRPATVMARLAIWDEALKLIRLNSLSGYGVGGYVELAKLEPRKLHADSWYITAWLESGIAGCIASIWLAAAAARRSRLCAGAAVAQLADYWFWHPACALAYGILLAVE